MTIYDAALRQGAIRRQNLLRGQKRSTRTTLPPPYLGLNTRSPVNQLEAGEAFELINLIPDSGTLRVREGSTLISSAGAEITSLATWSYENTDRLIWVHETTGGHTIELADSSSTYGTTVNGGKWFTAMMNGLLGMVSGQDQPVIYSGAVYPGTFSAMPITGPADPTRLRGIKIFKSRSYFWDSSLGIWYSSVNALGGSLTWFPLETVSQRGGSVMSVNSFTNDGGSGPDDFLVITTTRGEVIVYQGSNPNDPNDWALVGRYQISPPICQSGFLELDGQLWVVTHTDLEVLPDKFKRQKPLSKISNDIKTAHELYGLAADYTLFYDPIRDRILLNIPIDLKGNIDQIVKTAAGFTRFSGVPSECYAVVDTELYFGAGTRLRRWGGSYDFIASTPRVITFSAKTGYQMFGSTGEKRVAMYRCHMRAQGDIELTTAISFDYDDNYLTSQTQTLSSGTTQWGDPWGSPWSIQSLDRGDWLVGYGTGQSVSIAVSGYATGGAEWMGIDFEVVPGGMY